MKTIAISTSGSIACTKVEDFNFVGSTLFVRGMSSPLRIPEVCNDGEIIVNGNKVNVKPGSLFAVGKIPSGGYWHRMYKFETE